MVSRLDDIEVVLDDDDRVTAVDEAVQDAEELRDVGSVQSRRRLVEDVERAPRRAARQFRRELHALRLAARERRRTLPKLDVTEPNVGNDLELRLDARDILEELHSFVNRHGEHVGDRLSLVAHLKRLTIVSRSLADLAWHIDIGQEVHLDLDDAVAAARLAASALDVEAEAPGLVAAHLRLRRLTEELADGIEYARVRRRIRARRAPDRLLVDVDDLVDVLKSQNLLVLAGLPLRMVES